MIRTRDSSAYLVIFFTLVYSVSGKPPPKFSPWATYKGKPGVPMVPGMDTITVPYIGKSSSFFPKFVDPKMMISSKTGFLSNLFGNAETLNNPVSVGTDLFPFGASKSSIYARSIKSDPSQDVSDFIEILGDTTNEENHIKEEIKRGVLGPVSSAYGMIGPKFRPLSPWSTQSSPSYGSPFYGPNFEYNPSVASTSRTKRSLASKVTSSSPTYRPPPPLYPGLTSIPEESVSVSKTSYPFTPDISGTFGSYERMDLTPIVDPSIFIAKKTSFLNKLFSTLATSTPASPVGYLIPKNTIVPPSFWSPFETTTEASVPKSTVVPPGFWLPSSIVPSPGEYTQKVATFLDKLFKSINLNKTQLASDSVFSSTKMARSLELKSNSTKFQVKRSIEDLQTITAAKDAIVNSIITELASLKTEMVKNMDDFILSQKMRTSLISKKPIKTIKPPFVGLWASGGDCTAPFQQKMAVLSQAFDTLTEIQKNITMAVSEAIKKNVLSTEAPTYDDSVDYPVPNNYLFNVTLLDAVEGKLADLNTRTDYLAPKPFWMAFAKGAITKRDANNGDETGVYETKTSDDKNLYKRAVKMSTHQGYQSIPPGIIESIQTGGGSVPGHQEGGMKLLDLQYNDNDDWGNWLEYINNQYKDYRHNHFHN